MEPAAHTPDVPQATPFTKGCGCLLILFLFVIPVLFLTAILFLLTYIILLKFRS